jgi:hypothetical protein
MGASVDGEHRHTRRSVVVNFVRSLMKRLRRRRVGLIRRLDDEHPHVLQSTWARRGVQLVPVDRILGTAAAPRATRRSDFLPVAWHAPAAWAARWASLREAANRLEPLPPISLVQVGDSYWVADGHNRVALAKLTGQVAIDASVTDLRHLRGEVSCGGS